jgi:hypothetical protein
MGALTSLHILSKTSHGTLELGSLRMQHVAHVIVHLGLVVLSPSVQRSTGRQHGIARVTELRVNSCQSGRGTLGLGSTNSRCILLLYLGFACRAQDAIDFLQTICFAGPTSQVVGGPTVQERQVGNEEGVLDVGEGGEGRNFGIWQC